MDFVIFTLIISYVLFICLIFINTDVNGRFIKDVDNVVNLMLIL